MSTDGDLVITDADLITSDGDFVSTDGDLVITDADLATTDGDLMTADGDLVTSSGDLNVSTDGDFVITDDGNLATTDGDLVTTDGDLVASAGDLVSADGDLATTIVTAEANVDANITDVTGMFLRLALYDLWCVFIHMLLRLHVRVCDIVIKRNTSRLTHVLLLQHWTRPWTSCLPAIRCQRWSTCLTPRTTSTQTTATPVKRSALR